MLKIILSLLSLVVLASAQPDPPKTGAVALRFEERHPESAVKVQGRRLKWTPAFIKKHDPVGEYDLAKESFTALVPKTYDKKHKYGLFVWVSPVDNIGVEPQWRSWAPHLDERRIIAVSANNAGNERFVWYRIGLALDAAHNMPKLYNIDPARIWIGGVSGGGRVASTVTAHYPEIFAGGYYQAGCNWYREVKSKKGRKWPRRIPRPTPGRLAKAKKQTRHVFFCGSKDFNRDHSKAVYDDMKRQRYRHTVWQEAPGLGHVLAPPDWFEKGLAHLDAAAKPKPK
ncbi:MAG: hypothetical protein CMJ83_21335 [Planctomycetes bacterium]|nr:hypothetical protein [Planctomycetota bacterium]